MMKFLICFLICTLLSGCTTTQKIVYVPTPVKCPKPEIAIVPHYPVLDLTDKDKVNPGKVVNSYAVSLKMCIGQNKVMRKQLEGYNHDN